MKQVQTILFGMLLSFNVTAMHLTDFFILNDWKQSFKFWLENRKPVPVQAITLFFLESKDCQSGYIARYHVQDKPYILQAEQVFSINTQKIYLAMQEVAADKKVGSLLIRFIQAPKGFAFFEGGCADQDINCCIPVNCSSETQDCDLQIKHSVQPLYF
jgi:hypothetical protein